MRVLALSGSLRRVSKNTALLAAAALVAPEGVTVTPFEGLAELPPFNPDHEDQAPEPVRAFQAALAASDAVLICCPEYAHGLPGAFKNALDWVVGSGELVGRPVGLLNASMQADFAQANLRETLGVMSARLVEGACLRVPLAGPAQAPDTLAARPEVTGALRGALAALRDAAQP